MKIINLFKPKQEKSTESSTEKTRLVYASITSLERAIDSDDEFKKYFFAIYRCDPDQDTGINKIRENLRKQSPSDAVNVGKYFVLWGDSALKALTWYYTAITKTEALPEEYRLYFVERIVEIKEKHERSRSLTIDLSEGQLANDAKLNFYALLALSNGQILPHQIYKKI